jgi:hypothetical protein
MPMILPTQRTLFQSLISILERTMARGWGGGRVNCGRVHAIFNQEITPLEPRPNFILFDLLHCYKNSFTLSEITIGQEKMHGRCVQQANDFLVITLHLAYKGCKKKPYRRIPVSFISVFLIKPYPGEKDSYVLCFLFSSLSLILVRRIPMSFVFLVPY